MNRFMALSAFGLASTFIAAFVLGFPAEPHIPTIGTAHHHAAHFSASQDQTAYGQMSAVTSASVTSEAGETTFDTAMAQVNARMHAAMQVASTGDPDRDFARMMIPHHQGAIDMALVLLKYGHDERLKRLAQSIIVEQGQEIAYMRMLLGAPATEPSVTDPNTHQHGEAR